MNITEILQRRAELTPEAIAIVDHFGGRRRQISYRELDQAVGRTAALLRQSGLRVGDTVLLFHPMSIELYTSLAAVLRGGLTAMFVDPSAGRGHIDRCCELVPPEALIASSKAHALRLTSPALRRIPAKWSIGWPVPWTQRLELASRCADDSRVHTCTPETPALVSFTSGSTGAPKTTVRTHGFLLAQHAAIEKNLTLKGGEIELVTMPIFVLANLASGVTSIIANADLRHPARINAEPVLHQIQRDRATRFTASPAFFDRIVDRCGASDARLESVDKIFTGGGPVPPRLLERLSEIAPQAEIMVVYGSTEAEPISTVTIDQMTPRDRIAMNEGNGLLLGRPVDALNVRIIGDAWGRALEPMDAERFDAICRSPGQAGEIVVSGRHVLSGYVDPQTESENKFRVGEVVWHRTGDAGYFDRDDRLWLLGRCAARVDDRHGELYPLGVEQAAMRHACIGQAALVSHRGQRVLAVTLRDKHAKPDLPSLLKSLSFAKVDTIRILKRLPVDQRHNSKIDYQALRQCLEQ
jgi:acyl-CoA synthetase (AMP-forming)/AMP-acid ligase II